MKLMFSPSPMCMDLLKIREQIRVLSLHANSHHTNITGGHFVKDTTLSPGFVKAVTHVSRVPLDCHLMVTHPDDYVTTLAQAGATFLLPRTGTINTDAFRILHRIHEFGCRTGIVLNPIAPLSCIRHYLHLFDKVTTMSVNPGSAGQAFIREMLDKIKETKALKLQCGYRYLIEVDNSCNAATFQELRQVEVGIFIVGNSGLFQFGNNLHAA